MLRSKARKRSPWSNEQRHHVHPDRDCNRRKATATDAVTNGRPAVQRPDAKHYSTVLLTCASIAHDFYGKRGKTAPFGLFAMAYSLSCATHVKSLSRHKVLQNKAGRCTALRPFNSAPAAIGHRNMHETACSYKIAPENIILSSTFFHSGLHFSGFSAAFCT